MKLKMLGKAIPAWMLAGGLIMAASGAGVGTVLAGNITGTMPVTVSQSLSVDTVDFPAPMPTMNSTAGAGGQIAAAETLWDGTIYAPDRSIGVVSDDKTGFQSAAEINQGDVYVTRVCVNNRSKQDLVAQLDLNLPQGLEAEVFGSDEVALDFTFPGDPVSPNTRQVTRIGATSWKFMLNAGTLGTSVAVRSDPENEWQDCLGIQIISDDTTPPGFYTVSAKIKQIAY